jgi:hypothetical protein
MLDVLSFGDMMIVRAIRDLAPDTEINFWYHAPTAPTAEENDDRQNKLMYWGFRCDCTTCLDDQTTKRKILSSRKQQRMEILQYFKTGLKANLLKIENLIVAIESQYSQPASKVPRLHIWDLYLCLAQIYMGRKDPTKAISLALNSLSSLGLHY